eukprot:4040872-Prymnesium_polylepis.1
MAVESVVAAARQGGGVVRSAPGGQVSASVAWNFVGRPFGSRAAHVLRVVVRRDPRDAVIRPV